MIDGEKLCSEIKQLLSALNTKLPDRYVDFLKREFKACGERQKHLEYILDNSSLASDRGIPLCQDCGTVTVFIEKGRQLLFDASFEDIVNRAVRDCYTGSGFRKSMVSSPLERKNTGDNTPALIHVVEKDGSSLDIAIMLKGGGSENVAFAEMVNPGCGTGDLIDFILERTGKKLAGACPPLILGVGMGGSLDKAALLAKKALFREPGLASGKEHLRLFENELKEALNSMGTGPFGHRGKLCVLAVHAEEMPCHIASFPLAVNAVCHSYRLGRLHYEA